MGKLDSGGQFGYTLADDSIDANVLADGQASYQYGAGLVSEVRGGVSRAYHADALGTTRAMSGAGGTTTDTLETDAFGNTTSATGTTPSPFGFAGQHGYQTDNDSGLMRLGYRFYDASVGRFISRDPIQAGYNWYIYCDNDPVNAVDPQGLDGEQNTPPQYWKPPVYRLPADTGTGDPHLPIIIESPLHPNPKPPTTSIGPPIEARPPYAVIGLPEITLPIEIGRQPVVLPFFPLPDIPPIQIGDVGPNPPRGTGTTPLFPEFPRPVPTVPGPPNGITIPIGGGGSVGIGHIPKGPNRGDIYQIYLPILRF